MTSPGGSGPAPAEASGPGAPRGGQNRSAPWRRAKAALTRWTSISAVQSDVTCSTIHPCSAKTVALDDPSEGAGRRRGSPSRRTRWLASTRPAARWKGHLDGRRGDARDPPQVGRRQVGDGDVAAEHQAPGQGPLPPRWLGVFMLSNSISAVGLNHRCRFSRGPEPFVSSGGINGSLSSGRRYLGFKAPCGHPQPSTPAPRPEVAPALPSDATPVVPVTSSASTQPPVAAAVRARLRQRIR